MIGGFWFRPFGWPTTTTGWLGQTKIIAWPRLYVCAQDDRLYTVALREGEWQAVQIIVAPSNYSQEKSMLQLTDTQQIPLQIQPVNVKGRPAPVDGIPTWSLSVPSVATLTVSQDGMGAVLVATQPGLTQVNVKADADLGSGVKTITGALEVTVTSSPAVSLAIETGPITEQPV